MKTLFILSSKRLRFLLFFIVLSFANSVNAQCNAAAFTAVVNAEACSAYRRIDIQIPGASTCTGWTATLIPPVGSPQSTQIFSNGSSLGFGSLLAGSYNLSISNGATTIQYPGNPIIITTTYQNPVVTSVPIKPTCQSTQLGYSDNGSLQVNINSGGIGPFLITATGSITNSPSSQLVPMGAYPLTATFNGFAATETVSFTVVDQGNGIPGCTVSQSQQAVIPASTVVPLDISPYTGRNFRRLPSPNCNQLSSAFNIYVSPGLNASTLQLPGNATMSINGGPSQNITSLGYFAIGSGYVSFNGLTLNSGDTYSVYFWDGCTELTFSETITLDNNLLVVGQNFDISNCVDSVMTLRTQTSNFNGSYYWLNHFNVNNSLSYEFETSSGVWATIANFPIGSDNLPNITPTIDVLPWGCGNYRITAQDDCHTQQRIIAFNCATPDRDLDYFTITSSSGVLEGTGSVRIPTYNGNYYAEKNYPYTLEITPYPNLGATSVTINPTQPQNLAGAYTINFPIVQNYTQTGLDDPIVMGDIPAGQYTVKITNSCGYSKTKIETISPASYDPVINVNLGCQNSSSMSYDLNRVNGFFRVGYVGSIYQNNGGNLGSFVSNTTVTGATTAGFKNNLASGDYFLVFTSLREAVGFAWYNGFYGPQFSAAGLPLAPATNAVHARWPFTIPEYSDVDVQVSAALCDQNNSNSGVIVIDSLAGTPVYPMTFELFNPAVSTTVPIASNIVNSAPAFSHSFSNVPSGNYFVRISNPCYSVDKSIEIQSAANVATAQATDSILCPNNSGTTLFANISPFIYDITWSDELGVVLGDSNVLVLPNISVTSTYTLSYSLKPIVGCPPGIPTESTITIIIHDSIAPVISCASDTVLYSQVGSCSVAVPDFSGLVSVIDDCASPSDIIISQVPLAGTIFNANFNTTVWIYAEDPSGNIDSCSLQLTILDTIAPNIVSCVLDSDIGVSAGVCTGVLPDFTSNANLLITDNCTTQNANFTIIQVPVSGTVVSGTSTVWIYVMDVAGNIDSCSFLVTVVDTISPSIICPPDLPEIETDEGQCNASAINLGLPVVNDNCNVADIYNDAPLNFPIGTTVVTWTAIDDNGNISACEQLVTVYDRELPIIECPDDLQGVVADLGACSASSVNLGTPLTTDNCSVLSVVNDSPSIFPIGETLVTWTVTDGSGNFATCTQTVSVVDEENPTIICPQDLPSIAADFGLCSASGVVLEAPLVADNCSVFSVSNNAPIIFPLGTTIVNWTVMDSSGNSSSCVQAITVIDTQIPIFVNCLEDQTLTVNSSCRAYVEDYTNDISIVVSDNCSAQGDDLIITQSILPGTEITNDVVIWLYLTDAAGNRDSCSFKVDLNPCIITIYEIFSPNTDGENDFFYVDGLDLFPNTKVIIFNRWGTEVYQSDDYQNDWDGTSQSKYNVGGDVLPEGTYFYLLELGGVEGDGMFGKIYKGYVYLKR